MLQVIDICKTYHTGDLEQTALNKVSLNFRDNEFVAVLGPSGSGKTTLLNIIGGLDRYDSGDLIINGISTKDYNDKDWDAYRNHTIGFVFQSYNLIPHQTILSNVELSLTLSGISSAERKEKAAAALEAVGLGDQLHKKPNQLSGGQMQRVAIARALVNEPDIIMADEPTGALDSDTSIQIMDLLKSVAKDRLVIMVTHNPELAQSYATRIIHLKDGKITADSHPADPPAPDAPAGEKPKHTRLSFSTALGLSLNNLLTKKGRTFLTAFAGAIGIIGIAMIMALSNGANEYIASKESEMMGAYPIKLEKKAYDLSGFMAMATDRAEKIETASERELDRIYTNNIVADSVKTTQELIKKNNLGKFKTYLDAHQDTLDNAIAAVEYEYSVIPKIFRQNGDEIIPVSPASLNDKKKSGSSATGSSSMMRSATSSAWSQLVTDDTLRENQYTLLSGKWPQAYNEAALILTKNNQVSDYTLYTIGVMEMDKMEKLVEAVKNEEDYDDPEEAFSYDAVIGRSFKVFSPCELYSQSDSSGAWVDKSEDQDFLKGLYDKGLDITITGVLQATDHAQISSGVAYTAALTEKLMGIASDSAIVKQQLADPDTNVLTGKAFEEKKTGSSALTSVSNHRFSADKDVGVTSGYTLKKTAYPESRLTAAADLNALKNHQEGIAPAAAVTEDSSGETQPDQSPETPPGETEPTGYTVTFMNLDGSLLTETKTYPKGAAIDNLPASDPIGPDIPFVKALFIGWQSSVSKGVFKTADLPPVTEDVIYTPAFYTYTITEKDVEPFLSQIPMTPGSFDPSSMAGFSMPVMDAETMAQLYGVPDLALSDDALAVILAQYSGGTPETYEEVLESLGHASVDEPKSISIYPADFEGKDAVAALIEDYNDQIDSDADYVTYTDLIGLAMESITSIIDTISALLIGFVAISLVVSSIMIAIITYVSVLERTKEIGILRSIGATKNDVSKIFNAETFIEGLISGIFGIAVTLLICIPVNMVIEKLYDVSHMTSLPLYAALALIGIAVILTLIAGFIPARMASKKDPVEALRM